MSLCSFPDFGWSIPSLSFAFVLPELPTFAIAFPLPPFCPID